MKRLAILGSTGSIGTQTLDVVRNHPEEFKVVALSCGHNIELFRKQLREFKPIFAAVSDSEDAQKLSLEFKEITFSYGIDGLCDVATVSEADMVVNSLMGMLGLQPTYKAILAKKDIAFANKETLVVGGDLIMNAVKESNVSFLPVDSEHSAIFQSLQGSANNPVKKLILTASGGPFRGYTYEQLKTVKKEQALKHPNWSMGAKITIDSATMMNKGLEIIEAARLFDISPERIEVVVHPESAIHSAVEFFDGTMIAQLGIADMKMPIAYALSYPRRLSNICEGLDLFKLASMHFEKPDPKVFRCLGLALQAIEAGGSYTIVLNAANEEAVAAFLMDKISFTGIADVVEDALNKHIRTEVKTIDDILCIEKTTRENVRNLICK